MAEQFLSRLNEIEQKIEALGETLKRMITILTTVTEIKSEVRLAKENILEKLGEHQQDRDVGEKIAEDLSQLVVTEIRAAKDEILSAQSAGAKAGQDAGAITEQLAEMIKNEIGFLGKFLGERIESMKEELQQVLVSAQPSVLPAHAAAEIPTTSPAAPVSTPVEEKPAQVVRVPAAQGIKIAEQLERIIDSLKMGCKAGEVLDVMTDVKAEISKLTPSDPIMVKIDKWTGIVAGYQLRHELQARDILKIKKEIKEEIPNYRPA